MQAQVTTVTSTEAEKLPQGDSSVLICTSKSLGHKCRRAGREPVVGRTTSLLHRQHHLSGCCSCLLVGRWSNSPLMTGTELRKPQGPGSLEDRSSKRPGDSDEVITLEEAPRRSGGGPARPRAWNTLPRAVAEQQTGCQRRTGENSGLSYFQKSNSKSQIASVFYVLNLKNSKHYS